MSQESCLFTALLRFASLRAITVQTLQCLASWWGLSLGLPSYALIKEINKWSMNKIVHSCCAAINYRVVRQSSETRTHATTRSLVTMLLMAILCQLLRSSFD